MSAVDNFAILQNLNALFLIFKRVAFKASQCLKNLKVKG